MSAFSYQLFKCGCSTHLGTIGDRHGPRPRPRARFARGRGRSPVPVPDLRKSGTLPRPRPRFAGDGDAPPSPIPIGGLRPGGFSFPRRLPLSAPGESLATCLCTVTGIMIYRPLIGPL